MITLLVLWAALLFLSHLTGILVGSFFRVSFAGRPLDDLLLSLWLGLLLLHVLFLALSLAMPLTPYLFAAVFIALTLIVFLSPSKTQLFRIVARIPGGTYAWGLLFLIFSAGLSVQVISSRDAISYHFDNIFWLSRIGVTPGLALIHERLGYVSSWFTVPALFNHGVLSGRTGTASNGLALFLILFHAHASLLSTITMKARKCDLFLLFSIPPAIALPVMLNITVSTTPDFIILVIPLIISWVILMDLDEPAPGAPPSSVTFRDRNLVPLFLAACAFTVKIVTLPMVCATLFYYLFRKRFTPLSFLVGAAVTAVVVLPFSASLTVLSGCPLLPVPLCFDLPWTSPRDQCSLKDSFVLIWQTYFDPSAKLPVVKFFLAFLVLGGITLLLSMKFLRSKLSRFWPVLLLGVSGLLFLAVFVPAPRFAWGYVAIIIGFPALACREAIARKAARVSRLSESKVLVPILSASLILVPVAGASLLFKTKSEKRLAAAFANGTVPKDRVSSLLLPPIMPRITYDDERNLALPFPVSAVEPLPDGKRSMFYPLIPAMGISFIDTDKGARGGFRNSGGPENGGGGSDSR